jgi:hypothetical protein
MVISESNCRLPEIAAGSVTTVEAVPADATVVTRAVAMCGGNSGMTEVQWCLKECRFS